MTHPTSEMPSRIRRRADGGRQGHLLTLMGTNWEGYSWLLDIYISAANFLAVKHLNERSGEVLPGLPALMEGCDFSFTYEQRETEYNPMVAVQELVDATTDPRDYATATSVHHEEAEPVLLDLIWQDENTNHTTRRSLAQEGPSHTHSSPEDDTTTSDWQHPFAATGAGYSYVTIPLSIVGSAFELPLLSGGATSTDLDQAPLFGRTIPTNSGDAKAALLYYDSIGIERIAVLYVADSFGTAYHADLQQESALHFPNISLKGFPYYETYIDPAVKQLKDSGYRYIFGYCAQLENSIGSCL